MSYESEIKKINKRYDEVIEEITKVIEKDETAIEKLENIVGIDASEDLKKSIILQKEQLETKIKEIEKLKISLLKEARNKDRKEKEKKEEEERRKNQEASS